MCIRAPDHGFGVRALTWRLRSYPKPQTQPSPLLRALSYQGHLFRYHDSACHFSSRQLFLCIIGYSSEPTIRINCSEFFLYSVFWKGKPWIQHFFLDSESTGPSSGAANSYPINASRCLVIRYCKLTPACGLQCVRIADANAVYSKPNQLCRFILKDWMLSNHRTDVKWHCATDFHLGSQSILSSAIHRSLILCNFLVN